MENIHSALVSLNLHRQVTVTTPHNLGVLDVSYPPSAAVFRRGLSQKLACILDFHCKNGQMDAIHSAMEKLGYKNVGLQISETRWPSKGDADEAGASPENKKKYNRNLLKLSAEKKGSPMRLNSNFNVYVFALFNENRKTGPKSERNFRLFNPDGIAAEQSITSDLAAPGFGAIAGGRHEQ